MPSLRGAAVALVFVVGSACTKEPAVATPPVTLAEVRLKVDALRDKLGEDAYHRPEVEGFLKELARIPLDSPDYEEAHRYKEFLRAKRRIADQAMSGRPGPEPASPPPSHAPVRQEGKAPATKAELVKASDIKVGARRGDLLEAYGTCLVRQTWFRGERGGPTTEMFHVAPECRKELEPRVFAVANDRVERITAGSLDGLMTRSPGERSSEERSNEGRSSEEG